MTARMSTSQPQSALEPATVRTSEHVLTLLPSPESCLEALERDIARAAERVWVESFIVRDDALGERLLAWLSAASARGVDARLLYDPFGSRTTPPALFARFEAEGVAVRAYRPWHRALSALVRWPRDHARVFCADASGYVGGMAFGAEWLPDEAGGRGWHDVCCRIEGPAVDALARMFALRWDGARGESHPQNVRRFAWPDLALMADAPADKEGIYAVYRDRVRRARTRILIENGYFFPPRRLWRDLRAAARRGVDVQVIVPAGSDFPLLASAARGEYARWLRAGLSVFEYAPGMSHAKFALIDDDWATIGSFNLNPTSLVSTNECNVFVFDRQFVAAVAALFESDRAPSRLVTRKHLRGRPLRTKLTSYVLRVAMRAVESLAWLLLGAARRLRCGR